MSQPFYSDAKKVKNMSFFFFFFFFLYSSSSHFFYFHAISQELLQIQT